MNRKASTCEAPCVPNLRRQFHSVSPQSQKQGALSRTRRGALTRGSPSVRAASQPASSAHSLQILLSHVLHRLHQPHRLERAFCTCTASAGSERASLSPRVLRKHLFLGDGAAELLWRRAEHTAGKNRDNVGMNHGPPRALT